MSSSTTNGPVSTRILIALKKRVPADHWSTWFEHIQFEQIQFENNKLVEGSSATQIKTIQVKVPSTLHSSFLQQRYMSLFEEVLTDEFAVGTPCDISFQVASAAASGISKASPSEELLALNQNLNFDNFITGPSNQLAHAAAQAVADNPGGSYNPFFLHGSVGLGKTHLLQAVAHHLRDTGVKDVITISCASFTNEFISALSSGRIDQFRSRYRRAGALLIDDIQFLCDKERTQEEFFHTFNEIYNQERQVFLTSDAPPSEISGLSERLVSRFRLGLVVQMDPPDLETRMAIIRRKAQQRGFQLPLEVVEVVAHRIRDNIRELEGAVLRIESMSRHENLEINTETVTHTINELMGETSSRIDLRKIESLICEEFMVSSLDLHSPRRTRSIVLPRQVCMYLGRRHTDCSLGEIGQYFGGRDHSTVLHSIDKIRQSILIDSTLQRSVEMVEERLRRI
ncbi:MAG: chromosomal replication initiator protein DnaA [Planctomycetota bacterium]|nr:chromosomal replication initiator protein DnaA [Planctomycetota bacterium]